MQDRSAFGTLFIAILILDQVVKTVALWLLAPGQSVALLPFLHFTLASAPAIFLAPDRLRLLVAGLLATLLLVRLHDKGLRGGELARYGIQLIAGGVFSGVLDLLLWRDNVGVFAVRVFGQHPYVSLADAAVLVGTGMLAGDLVQRRPAPSLSQVRLLAPAPLALDLSRFKRGIDNVHVDVRLSPRFMQYSRELISGILAPNLWWESWRGAPPQPSRHQLDRFAGAYGQLIESAVHRARLEENAALVALAQLSAVKFVVGEVRGHVDKLLREFRRELDYNPPVSTRTMARMSQHLIALQRRRSFLIEDTAHLLLERMGRVEEGPVNELRRSLLGDGATIPGAVFDNPVLLVDDPQHHEFQMRHYVLMGHRADDSTSFKNIERLLLSFFDCAQARGSADDGETAGRRRSADAVASAGPGASDEGREERCRWLDVPENADMLLDVGGARAALQRARYQRDFKAAREQAGRRRYRHRMLRRLYAELRRHGLVLSILSAYQTADLWNDVDLPISPRSLQRYLMGSHSRDEIAAKLRRVGHRLEQRMQWEQLDEAAYRVHHCRREQRYEYFHRFVVDVLRYRRDLKQARIFREWIDQVTLLEDADSVRLSRLNQSLYELLTPDDDDGARVPAVAGHVVLKADVRGSTAMTEELAQRGLNPASHFDINFFDPIRNLIELYGAEKVFVEGDAVILALLEHKNPGRPQLAVARACGLARSILEVVATQNATGGRYGLPPLELGIGIAYEAAAPTYLFDNSRPIMISSAISRADRLSSCAAFLRRDSQGLVNLAQGQRLQVFRAEAKGPVDDKKGSNNFRYNVDGVELEPAAFDKLSREIFLQRLELVHDHGVDAFHVGRYPDARGVMRTLVVREGMVSHIDRRAGSVAAGGEPFYEVVVDSQLLRSVERRSSVAAPSAEQRPPSGS
ncbi:MAG: signal peptidase II [Gammaproteobacteria bacterium]